MLAEIAHVVVGATGTLRYFAAGNVSPLTGAATIAVDLKKNGTTVLTGTITLDSGDAAYAVVEGTLDGDEDDLVAGDVLTVHADYTVTLGLCKLGLVSAPGFTYAGQVRLVDIGIPEALCARHGVAARLLDERPAAER